MKKAISIFLSVLIFLFSFNVDASPFAIQSPVTTVDNAEITTLKKGDKAPFDGTLFNVRAATELSVNLENAEEQCRIKTEKEVGLASARLQLNLDNMTAAKEAAERKANEIVDLKNDQIKFLEEQAIKSAKKEKNVVWWLVGGLLGGVALTVGSAAVLQATRQ